MRNYEKLEKENRLIVLPVPVGTTVYEVIPPCKVPSSICPFNGGYGSKRCKGYSHCKAYIEEVKYEVWMYGNKSIYIHKDRAEKAVERLNGRR